MSSSSVSLCVFASVVSSIFDCFSQVASKLLSAPSGISMRSLGEEFWKGGDAGRRFCILIYRLSCKGSETKKMNNCVYGSVYSD